MKRFRIWEKPVIFMLSAVFLAIPGTTLCEESHQRWEVLNPQGVVEIEPMKINPHPSTLEGKNVLLR